MDKIIEEISNLVVNLKYYEWCKIRTAIDKKFSSEQAKIQIGASSDEIAKLIKLEF